MSRTASFILAILAATTLFAGCGRKNAGKAEESFQKRPFPPTPSVPAMITDQKEAAIYVASNFWNEFLSTDKTYPCDTSMVNGVANEDVESALGMFVTILERGCSMDFSRKAMDAFFTKVEKFQAADTSSNVFSFFEKMVAKYLYDPNSPVRNEDIYQPYVARLSKSRFTDEGMQMAYEHDAEMCQLNRVGTPAADFAFTGLNGKKYTLYGIKADYALLFFSNPGCPACREITDQLNSDEKIQDMINSSKLVVINVYIDEELDKWREYAVTYPKEWYSGYDHTYKIRTDVTYNVRAIPSLYVLDSQKRVIMKDATTENVLNYFDMLN